MNIVETLMKLNHTAGEDVVGEGVPDAEQDGVHGDADGAGDVEQLHPRRPQHRRRAVPRGEGNIQLETSPNNVKNNRVILINSVGLGYF